MTGAEQDAEYLSPLYADLADIFTRTAYAPDPTEFPVEWANEIINQLTERGWRFVTAKDWKSMTHAWVMGAQR